MTGEKREQPADVQRRPKPSWAAIGIFLILAFAAVTLARNFLMPVTLALLLFLVFAPLCRWLAHLRIPQSVSAAFVALGLFALLLVMTASVAAPLSQVIDDAPRIFSQITTKVASVRGSLSEFQSAIDQINKIASGGGEEVNADLRVVAAEAGNDDKILTAIATTTPTIFAQFVFTLILLFFALSSRELLYSRTVESFGKFRDKRRALEAIHAIERSLGQYLGAITLINAGLGVAVGLAMWAWGMPEPALFGLAAFAFNYVPYVGAIAGVMLSTIVALVSMNGVVDPVLVGLTYLALTSAEGQLITPYFVSQRLQLNTAVVFVAVALFAWLWSIVGMIVAVPLLVVLNVVCCHVDGLKGMGAFLSGGEADERPMRTIPEAREELPETQRANHA